MLITEKNIGDVIRLNYDSRIVEVYEVTDNFVTYLMENGDRYASTEREVDGVLVTDPQRVRLFKDHYELGAALYAARAKSLAVLLDSGESELSRQTARGVLNNLCMQQAVFDSSVMGASFCGPNNGFRSSPNFSGKTANCPKREGMEKNILRGIRQ